MMHVMAQCSLACTVPSCNKILPAMNCLSARCIELYCLSGNGLWLNKSQSQCLILWRKLPEWAAALHEWALSSGMQDAVTSIEEIMDGEDSHGTGMVMQSMQFMW